MQKNIFCDDFGHNLKSAMIIRGFTVDDLSKASGLSQIDIFRYFGGTSKPGVASLIHLAKALQVDVFELVPALDVLGSRSLDATRSPKGRIKLDMCMKTIIDYFSDPANASAKAKLCAQIVRESKRKEAETPR